MPEYWIFRVICVNFGKFLNFVYFCISNSCSARSQLIFVGNKSETSEKNPGSEEITTLVKNSKSQNHADLCRNLRYFRRYGPFFDRLWILHFFCIRNWCSARSEMGFLGKKSETCQKSLSSEEITTLTSNHKSQK